MNAGWVIFIQWTSLNNCVLFDHINSDLPGLGVFRSNAFKRKVALPTLFTLHQRKSENIAGLKLQK